MFRTLKRIFFPNPLDRKLKKAAKAGAKKVVLGWNRGLGDIALGLYAIVHRIVQWIPDAEIVFLTRESLLDGFSMLHGVKAIGMSWKRGENIDVKKAADEIGYDLLMEAPDPSQWVVWQRGKLTPKLKWDTRHDTLFEAFDLKEKSYVALQPSAETNYGLWRNWPAFRVQELISSLEKKAIPVLLFGMDQKRQFFGKNVVDLRGKTTLFQLLSIIKNKVHTLVLPDSGISSMVYYLDEAFPIKLITLWADPNHGILKQAVDSPNPLLEHHPIIAAEKDLSSVSAKTIVEAMQLPLEPVRPLSACYVREEVEKRPLKTGAILLAAGQGTRLQFPGPKGLFSIGGKTLFEHLLRKKDGPIAIMTSKQNHDEIKRYLQTLKVEVSLFQQDEMPLLSKEGKLLEKMGPNGNGNVFKAFCKSAVKEIFAKEGVEFITVSYIDNPLTDLFDEALISLGGNAEAVVQCIRRDDKSRSMGVLVERNGVEIVEYTELDPKIDYKYAYSGQMGFSFEFFCKVAEIELPLHWVRKTVDGALVWKGEQYIFDALAYASKVNVLEVEKERYFAPIKSMDQVEEADRLLRLQEAR